MSSIVSNNSLPAVSVSQNAQDSQIRYFKLSVDTLFLCMENNLEDPKKDNMYKNEEDIEEKSERVTMYYNNLEVSDEKKSELRQYILKGADVFNSKFGDTYGKEYMDNYFDFIKHADFDEFELRQKLDKGTFFYPKKPIDVIVTDSDSESEDEVSMFSETQSEHDSSDSESEEEEDDDETMYDSEEEEEDISNLDLEEEYRFYRKRTNELDKENEELKESRRDLGSKVAILTRENEVKDLNIKRLEALREQDNCIINQFIQNSDSREKLLDERDEQIKNLKAVIDDLRTQKDENIEQIRQQKEDFDKMKKSRDHFEWLNKKRQENEIFLINQQNKTQDENALKFNERDDKIKELKKSLEESKNMHADTANKLDELRNDTCDYEYMHVLSEKNNELKKSLEEMEKKMEFHKNENEYNLIKLGKMANNYAEKLEEKEHNHSVDANELFKQIIRNGKLKKQIRLLKLLIK